MAQPLNARDSLAQAFKETSKDYAALAANGPVRGLMSLMLRTLSETPEGASPCTSWADVEVMVQEVVEEMAPEEFAPVKEDLKKFFAGVVSRAQKTHPVFVTPPPYE